MTEPTDRSAIVLPFGKHKGSTVAELLTKDPQYAEWIVAQGWVAERFAELHAAILSRGATTDDSPEHNAIQVRFLDEAFRAACTFAIKPKPSHTSIWSGFSAWLETSRAEGKFRTQVEFEKRGVDVWLYWGAGLDRHWCRGICMIEIKPTMGDDFPSVMRQMERLQCDTLVLDEYTGRAVSAPQLRQMFEANGKRLIFVRDIEAEFANARAELE